MSKKTNNIPNAEKEAAELKKALKNLRRKIEKRSELLKRLERIERYLKNN